MSDSREGRFFRKATHDLRSPVAVTRILLSVLSQGYVGPLNPGQADMVARADRKLALLQTLVDDLIDLAAAKAGFVAQDRRLPIGLVSLVGKACARLEPAAREKRVELLFCPCAESVVASVDPDEFELLLNHLIGNAVTYTSRGEIHVSIDHAGEFARLVVDDDGMGIPDEARPHLFEEFYRAANAKAVHEQGTGLGLVIVKAIVDRNGGSIDVTSAEGRGTTVTVRLPLA